MWEKPQFWYKSDSYPLQTRILNSFPMARALPGLGNWHWKCPKSPFLARVKSVQSIDTKWHFLAILYETVSLFWFSLFLFRCQDFGQFLLTTPLLVLWFTIQDFFGWLLLMLPLSGQARLVLTRAPGIKMGPVCGLRLMRGTFVRTVTLVTRQH